MKKGVIIISVFALVFGDCKPKTTSTNLPTTFPQTDMLNIQQQENTILREDEVNSIQILDAEKIMLEASKIGLKKLEKIIDPMILVYLDSSFCSTLIELEFQTEFLEKHFSNDNVYFFNIPKYTFELADEHNKKEALEKLFEYYIQIPKFVKSDTIYVIYNKLNDFLKILVKLNNPNLSKRLLQDYKEWNELARVSKPKSYLSKEEYIEMIRNTPFDEQLKFKEDDLYIDCSYKALQLAGALNYLKAKGFDSELLEGLKKQQTYPFASNYKFLISNFASTQTNEKVVPNTDLIKNFEKDYQKIEKFLFKNVENCCGAKITKIVYDKSKAYVFVSRNNGSDDYLLKLNTDNTITIEFISMIIE